MNKAWVVLLLLLSACAPHQEGSTPIGESSQAFGGVPVTPETENREFLKYVVVFRTVKDGEYFTCTGSNISPDFVAVNAHCLIGDPQKMQVFFFVSSAHPAALRKVPAAFVRKVNDSAIPPQSTSLAEGKKRFDPYDIALLQLDKPAPAGTKFFSLSDQTITPQVMRRLGVLGYGYESLTIRDFNEKGEPILDEPVGDLSLRALFQTVLPSSEPDMIELDGEHGSSICIGDSGGPNFTVDNTGHGMILYGLTAQRRIPRKRDQRIGMNLCRINSNSVDISLHKEWMLQTIQRMRYQVQASAR